MLELDGSRGEGGGQVLRTALALSVATGTPFRIIRIRAGRPRPGLRPQHVAAVRAAAAVGSADVDGAEPGSSVLTFAPSGVVPGGHHFDVGTAGSACLVAQTVLPALTTATAPSQIVVSGGTHNRAAPPFDFFARAYLPVVRMLGPQVTARLDRFGFEPAGGGRVSVDIAPVRHLTGIELLDRGRVTSRRARAVLSRLPAHIAERELGVVRDRLGWTGHELAIETVTADGPGNVLLLEITSERVNELFTGFGWRGKPAEAVAEDAVAAARAYLDADVPIGPHLADQLLVPLALGAGGAFVTGAPSTHLMTNATVIRDFLDVTIRMAPLTQVRCRVEVVP